MVTGESPPLSGAPATAPEVFGYDDGRPQKSSGWIARFGLLYLGQNVAWAAPSQLLVASQIAIWHPASKEDHLAWIMAAGGIVSLIATPLAGYISDRTRSRFGRRRPWILIGAILGAMALVAMGFATGYAMLVAAWMVFQFGIALSINSAQSVPPDQVSRGQYGTVSGVMGLTYTLAIVVGTVIAALFGIQVAYLMTAAVLVALVLQYVLTTDDPLPPPREAAAAEGDLLPSGFPSWRSARDYWWVFITRLLVTLGNTIALFYLFYFLRDRIGMTGDGEADTGVLILTAIYAVTVVPSALISWRLSDRWRRRKPFVAAASYGVALATGLMAIVTQFTGIMLGAAILGVAWGVYTAVDQALINEVLPSADDRGRDMGIMNIAVAVPNTCAPVVAALALKLLGGYPGLYLLAALLAIVGGVLLRQVKAFD